MSSDQIPQLEDLDVANIQVVNGKKGKVFIQDTEGQPIRFKIGSRAQPVVCDAGLMKPQGKVTEYSRRTYEVPSTTQMSIKIKQITEAIENNPRTPIWARNDLHAPMSKTGEIRLKIGQDAGVTVFQNDQEVGEGTLADVSCNTSLAQIVEISDLWNFVKEDGMAMSGFSFVTKDLMCDVTNATQAPPPMKRAKW